jgi:transcriptional regulator with XRE-family HTH domain
MASRVDQERVQVLLQAIGLNDREIGEQIGVTQSTVWRLRHRKISKVSKYITKLSALASSPAGADHALNPEKLVALAEHSPALKSLLVSLIKFMQEDA